MRISDDRYSRERLSLDLALRFLRHEARTQTIRMWTGLTDDRIRNLYRSYMSRGGEFVPRHRGKSPHQIAYFMRSARLQWETSQLASLLTLLNVVPAQPGLDVANTLPAVSRGERLCCAFEIYQTTIPASQISFEHTVFLAVALARGDQLRMGGCRDCGGLMVAERFPLRERRCQYCTNPALTGSATAGTGAPVTRRTHALNRVSRRQRVRVGGDNLEAPKGQSEEPGVVETSPKESDARLA